MLHHQHHSDQHLSALQPYQESSVSMMRVHVEMVHPLLVMQPCGLIPNLTYYPPQSEALRGHKATCQSSDS
eukprot:scaffold3669_cov148-Chaetoceros_neogracile.AAC.1